MALTCSANPTPRIYLFLHYYIQGKKPKKKNKKKQVRWCVFPITSYQEAPELCRSVSLLLVCYYSVCQIASCKNTLFLVISE